jgi:hypothetical protein
LPAESPAAATTRQGPQARIRGRGGVDRPHSVNRLDVEYGQFVVLEILRVEGIFDGDVDNWLLQPEDRVEQADQTGAVLRGAKGLLEGEVIDRADSKRHGRRQ